MKVWVLETWSDDGTASTKTIHGITTSYQKAKDWEARKDNEITDFILDGDIV